MLKALNSERPSSLLLDIGYQMSREKTFHTNNASSIQIIQTLKQVLSAPRCPLMTKVTIYESFYALIKTNRRLVPHVAELVLAQLDPYIINTTTNSNTKLTYLDLAKCLSTTTTINDDTTTELRLFEPIDVLFHLALICLGQMTTDHVSNQRAQTKLRTVVDAIVACYLNNSAQFIFDLYKDRLNKAGLVKQPRSAASFKIVHQIELGIIDSIIDHIFQNDMYRYYCIIY